MSHPIPPLGTRFAFFGKRVRQPMTKKDGEWILENTGSVRVWELVESLPLDGLRDRHNPHRAGYDRHTLRCVEERGFLPANSYGIGHEMHVEDAWFRWRTDAKRLPPAKAVA